MKLFLQKNKGIYQLWITSYFIFILIFLIGLISIILLARNVLQREIFQTNEAMFQSINSDFENMKNETDKLATQIALNQNVISLFNETRWDNTYYFNVNKVKSELEKLLISYNFVEEVCLYNIEADTFFINGGIFAAENHYSSYFIEGHADSEESFTDWKEFIQGVFHQELYRASDGCLLYLHSIMLQNRCVGTIMIKLSTNDIKRKFQYLKNGCNILYINHLDEPIFAFKDDDIKRLAEQKELDLSTGQKTVQDNQEMMIYVSGPKSKVKCLYSIPQTIFYKSVNLMLKVFAVLTILFVFVGCVLALYYSKKNYRPVKKTLNLLEKYQYSNLKSDDEFTFINDSLNSIISEGFENKIIKSKYHKILFNSELLKFLKSGMNSRTIEELFEFYDISFSYQNYLTAIISINDINDDIWEIDINDGKTEDKMIEVAIINIYNEILGENFKTLTVCLNDNMSFCLIGTNITEAEKIKENLRERFLMAQTFTKEKTGIEYSVYLSEVFKELGSLKKMYEQSNTVYGFNVLNDKNVFSYDEVARVKNKYELVNFEELFLEAIQKGNLIATKNLIVQILEQQGNMSDSAYFSYMKYYILNLLSNQIRYVAQYDENICRLAGIVNGSGSLIEFLKGITELIEHLCILQINYEEQDGTDVIDHMIKYIGEHYSDAEMNVDQLGIHFSLTPSYLSSLFKLKKGELLRDYITRVRLQNSQAMLLADSKVEEVAVQSGFSGAKTFVRAFKRVYGITPGQYKKDYQSEKSNQKISKKEVVYR